MPKIEGSSIRVTNAILTLTEYTSKHTSLNNKTYILQITTTSPESHISVWLNKDELLEIKQLIDDNLHLEN